MLDQRQDRAQRLQLDGPGDGALDDVQGQPARHGRRARHAGGLRRRGRRRARRGDGRASGRRASASSPRATSSSTTCAGEGQMIGIEFGRPARGRARRRWTSDRGGAHGDVLPDPRRAALPPLPDPHPGGGGQRQHHQAAARRSSPARPRSTCSSPRSTSCSPTPRRAADGSWTSASRWPRGRSGAIRSPELARDAVVSHALRARATASSSRGRRASSDRPSPARCWHAACSVVALSNPGAHDVQPRRPRRRAARRPTCTTRRHARAAHSTARGTAFTWRRSSASGPRTPSRSTTSTCAGAATSCDAATRAGVERIVYTSTVATLGLWETRRGRPSTRTTSVTSATCTGTTSRPSTSPSTRCCAWPRRARRSSWSSPRCPTAPTTTGPRRRARSSWTT